MYRERSFDSFCQTVWVIRCIFAITCVSCILRMSSVNETFKYLSCVTLKRCTTPAIFLLQKKVWDHYFVVWTSQDVLHVYLLQSTWVLNEGCRILIRVPDKGNPFLRVNLIHLKALSFQGNKSLKDSQNIDASTSSVIKENQESQLTCLLLTTLFQSWSLRESSLQDTLEHSFEGFC